MRLLEETLAEIVPQDVETRLQAKERLEQLTMPRWALGRLMDLAVDLAGITRSLCPRVERRMIVTMAGDHGVAAEGVSLFPQEVTGQMVANFVNGGAGVNALARQARADVMVVDLGVAADLSALARTGKIISLPVAKGTHNMAVEAAMSRTEAVRAVEAGIQVARELGQAADVFGTGDMGIANTTPSSAIVSVFSGLPVADVTGTGTGIEPDQLSHKVSVIERALALNNPDPKDGLDVLAKVGGFEIGGIAGLILGAAALRKPVVVDGFISTAGALVAHALCPAAADYMISAHRSQERGHIAALRILRKTPLIDLDLRLGEGTGAALAMNFLEAAFRILTEVATFDEAHVSGANE